ncbi:unnamed protein product [Calypogeia fissa]
MQAVKAGRPDLPLDPLDYSTTLHSNTVGPSRLSSPPVRSRFASPRLPRRHVTDLSIEKEADDTNTSIYSRSHRTRLINALVPRVRELETAAPSRSHPRHRRQSRFVCCVYVRKNNNQPQLPVTQACHNPTLMSQTHRIPIGQRTTESSQIRAVTNGGTTERTNERKIDGSNEGGGSC